MNFSTRSGVEENAEKRGGDAERGEEGSWRQNCIPVSLIPDTDLPVCVYQGLGLWAGLVVFSGYFYKDVCPPTPLILSVN